MNRPECPFQDASIGDNNETVKNEFTGEEVMLTPEAVATYDVIKGAEMFGLWNTVRIGLDWFRKHYPREYMTLLD